MSWGGWVNEGVCDSENSGGICGESAYRVKSWQRELLKGVVDESKESKECDGELA